MAGWKLDKLPVLPGSGVAGGRPALGPENIGAHLAALQAKRAPGPGGAAARPEGARRAALKRPAEVLRASPAQVRPNLEDAEVHREQQRQRFEARLAQGDAADVVQLWCDYAEWTAKNQQANHASVVKRACHSLVATKRHHDDVRHLRLWVQYGCVQDEPHKVFGMLCEHGVGVGHSLLYEAWAACCEKRHCFFAADEAYRRGIERGAHPLAKLRGRHAEFEQRMSRRDARRGAAGEGGAVAAAPAAAGSGSVPPPAAAHAASSASEPPGGAPPAPAAPCGAASLSSRLDQLWRREEERTAAAAAAAAAASASAAASAKPAQEPAAPAASGTKRARAEAEESGGSSAAPAEPSAQEPAEEDGGGKRPRLAAWVATPFSRFWAARPAQAADKAPAAEPPAAAEEEEEEEDLTPECWSTGMEALGQVLLESSRAEEEPPAEVVEAPVAEAPRTRWLPFFGRARR